MAEKKTRIHISGRPVSTGEVNRFVTNYKVFTQKASNRLRKALFAIGQTVLSNTIPFTPIDTGALRSSGRFQVQDTGRGPRVKIAFGGPDFKVKPTKNAPEGIVFYAAFVHENVGGKYRVGGPKFLTRGIKVSRPQIEKILEEALKAEKVK